MSIPRFFIAPSAMDLLSDYVTINNDALVHQICHVMRMEKGDELDLLDGMGTIYHCRIVDFIRSDLVTAKVVKSEKAKEDSSIKLTVVLPMLKADRFEWALEKLTEIGVTLIVPTIVERSVVKSLGRMKRWQAIVKEAAEQSERAIIPNIVCPLKFSDFVSSREFMLNKSEKFLCAERIKKPLLSDVLCNLASEQIFAKNILVMVGPEGGFTANELNLALKCGINLVSLGQRILRSETAAICAATLVISLLDCMNN